MKKIGGTENFLYNLENFEISFGIQIKKKGMEKMQCLNLIILRKVKEIKFDRLEKNWNYKFLIQIAVEKHWNKRGKWKEISSKLTKTFKIWKFEHK